MSFNLITMPTKKVLSSYGPVKFGPLGWSLIVDIETKEAFSLINTMILQIAGLSLILVLVLILAAVKFSNTIVKPIEILKKTMVNIVSTGDFSQRVDINCNNEIGQSADSFNDLLVNLEETITDVNHVVAGIAEGKFHRRVAANVQGDLEKLKTNVNQSAHSVSETMNSLSNIMDALAGGNFKHRMTCELKGEFKDLGNHVDKAMSSIDDALASIHEVMVNISKGNLNTRVNKQLPGELGEMKININSSLDTLMEVFSDTGRVLEAVSTGDLNESITRNYEGEFNKLTEYVNATVDKLTEIVKKIQDASHLVNSKADSIMEGNLNLSGHTDKHSENLEDTAASMNEITSTVENTATNASQASDLACEAREWCS